MPQNPSLEVRNGVGTTTDAHLDVKFEVLNNLERDALIIGEKIKQGKFIFHKTDNKHYWLKEYPTPGSLVGVDWKPVGNEKTGDINENDSEKVPDTTVTYQLKQLIDNLTFLDKDVPPVLIDAQSGDGINDTIRFTFKGGTTVDLNAELFVNLNTFKEIRYKASNKFILELVNVDNSIDELNLETILQEYVRIDNVTQYLSETVYYLDNTIVDSSESQANNVNKPYKDLPELLQALPSNDGRPIVIFSLTESTYTGAILPNRNLIFDARKSFTIDFTGINTAVPANGGNTGRLIENSSVIVETSVFHFVEGKVNLISTTNDAMQIFNTGNGVSGVKYTGTLGKFDFQSLSGTNASLDRIFGSRIETDFTINEFVIYRQKGFNFKENSNITIKKLTVKGTNTGVDASDNKCTFNIEDINLAVASASITFVDKSIINIHKITGTGQVTTYSSTVHLNFVDCEIANTANVIFSGGIMSGNIISGSENVSHAAAAVFDITFKNFIGSIDKINLRNTVASFEGNNKINIRNNFINIHTSDNTERDVAIIKNGLTLLDFTTPTNTFISNPLVNRKVNIHSELQTNCTDVSDYVYYSFNAIRGIEVQDENDISKWISRKLKFKGAEFDAEKNIITGLWNTAKTILSKFINNNTSARNYTLQDRDGTIADDTDLAGKQNKLAGETNKIPKSTDADNLIPSRLEDTGSALGIETTYLPTLDITLGNNSNKIIGVEESDANTKGRDLTISAGRTNDYRVSSVFSFFASSNLLLMDATVSPTTGITYAIIGNSINTTLGQIYSRANPNDDFVLHDNTNFSYKRNIRVDSNNNLYITSFTGVYKQTNCEGAFVKIFSSGSAINIQDNGKIFVRDYSNGLGSLFESDLNGSNFIDTGFVPPYSRIDGIASNSKNEVYLYTKYLNGQPTKIYFKSEISTSFVEIFSEDINITGITIAENDNVYVSTTNGILEQVGGLGSFNLTQDTLRDYSFIYSNKLNGNIYTVSNSDIYELSFLQKGTDDLDGGTLKLKAGTGKGTGQSRYQIITGQKQPSGTDMQPEVVRLEVDEEGRMYYTEDKSSIYTDRTIVDKNYSDSLKYVEVSASRDLLPTDNGKTLVVTATGVLLTIPATGLQDDFNCTITPTTGNDATINVGSVTADENGLSIAPQEMKSIGRLGSTYIIRP